MVMIVLYVAIESMVMIVIRSEREYGNDCTT